MTERNPVFDMMKGFAIFLMIVGHCQIDANLHHAIYLFHIPMFLIISGYFYRPKEVKAFVLSDLKRLILPYLIFSAIVFLKYTLDGFRLHDFSTVPRYAKSIFTGNFGIGPIWFLLALFWCRQLFNVAMKTKTGILLLIFAAGFVSQFGINIEYSLSFFVGVSCVLFYAIGFFWAKKLKSFSTSFAVVYLVIAVGVFFFCGEMDVHTLLYPQLLPNVIGAFAATLLGYCFFNRAEKVMVIKNFFGFYGRWSLLLLGVHYVEFMLFDWNSKIPNPIAIVLVRVTFDALIVFGLSKLSISKKFFF